MKVLGSTTTGKSSGGWLDRLRTSKGLPLYQPDLNLDHFLHQPALKDKYSTFPTPPPQDATAQRESFPADQRTILSRQDNYKRKITAENDQEGEKDERIFRLMRRTLAELFRMGDIEDHERNRALRDGRNGRKQLKPKVCLLHVPAVEGERAQYRVTSAFSLPTADDNTSPPKKRSAGRAKQEKQRATTCGNGTADPELVPRSCTVVTAIDTSCSPEWKAEKLIFRKGTIWKVRDKKLWILSKKNRKSSNVKLVGDDRPFFVLDERGKNENSSSTNVVNVADVI